MPLPLSLTRIIVTPPWRISMVTLLAPASIEFSTSSLTTEDGRSTTLAGRDQLGNLLVQQFDNAHHLHLFSILLR